MKINNLPLEDVLEEIKCLFHEGKTDRQVSEVVNIPIIEIIKIRKQILGILLYDRKIICANCNKPRSVFNFSKKSTHPDWCCICRKQYGGEKGSGRPVGKKNLEKKESHSYTLRFCLRCNKPFKSFGLNRICNRCNLIITSIERISI